MLKRKEKIKLICNSPSDGLIDLFPIVKGKMPDFFNSLLKNDLNSQKLNNVKLCTGLTDLYNNAIQIPAWQDFRIVVKPSGNVEIQTPQQQWGGMSHPLQSQAPGVWPNFVNVKLTCPWLLECNQDVMWTMIQPVWDQVNPLRYIVVPGKLEFKYQNMANINLLFPITKNETTVYEIKAGEILAIVVPNFDHSYDLELKYISSRETERLLNKRWTFNWGYTSYAKLRALLRNKK